MSISWGTQKWLWISQQVQSWTCGNQPAMHSRSMTCYLVEDFWCPKSQVPALFMHARMHETGLKGPYRQLAGPA